MAPYFPKYGQSRRFHDMFVEAEAQAKAAKRGIWAADAMSYPDYDEREAWWGARGAFVAAFRKEGENNPAYIDVSHEDAMEQLQAQLDKEVHVLGTVEDVKQGDRGPARVLLAHSQHKDFPLIVFDPNVLAATGLVAWKGEYVVATGKVSIYENKHTHEKQLQIIINNSNQVRLSDVPGLTRPAASGAAAN
jgi:hypothetical protein